MNFHFFAVNMTRSPHELLASVQFQKIRLFLERVKEPQIEMLKLLARFTVDFLSDIKRLNNYTKLYYNYITLFWLSEDSLKIILLWHMKRQQCE